MSSLIPKRERGTEERGGEKKSSQHKTRQSFVTHTTITCTVSTFAGCTKRTSRALRAPVLRMNTHQSRGIGSIHLPVCAHAQGCSLPLVLGHVEGHFISLVDFTLVIHVCECIRHKEVLLQGHGRPGGQMGRQTERCMTMHSLQFFHK